MKNKITAIGNPIVIANTINTLNPSMLYRKKIPNNIPTMINMMKFPY